MGLPESATMMATAGGTFLAGRTSVDDELHVCACYLLVLKGELGCEYRGHVQGTL